MSRTPLHRSRKHARRVLDSLALLFESDLPDGRAEAEAELRESGLDPEHVGRRLRELAETTLAGASRATPPAADTFSRRPRAAEDLRTAREPARSAERRTTTLRQTRHDRSFDRRAFWAAGRPFASIAAMLAVFVLGYVVGRHRTNEMPGVDRLAPAPVPAGPSSHTTKVGPDAFTGRLGDNTASRQHPAGATDAGVTRPRPDLPSTGPLAQSGTHAGVPPGSAVGPAGTTRRDLGTAADASRGTSVEPGNLITKAGLETVSGLISPGVEWCIRHGLVMEIVPYKKVEWNKAYLEATNKYAGHTTLAPDGRSIVGYVAGLPFPNLDPNDPQIALKIMWNYEYKPYVTDSEQLRNVEADSGLITSVAPMSVERRFVLQGATKLFFTGRLYVDPKPERPNPDHVRFKSSVGPLQEPSDQKGIGLLSVRYVSPDREDDTWLYLPSMRRVRRLASAQRSDALLQQDFDIDSFGGFAGQIPLFDWKYIGEKEILASFHSRAFPTRFCEGGGDFIFCDTWEKRKAYVVEGVPKLPEYASGKRLLFIDQETYLVAYSDVYDRSGQLWKVVVNQWSFRKQATPSYGIPYEDEMPFHPSVTTVDMKVNHATRAALPSPNSRGEQGWYFNQGERGGLSDESFTVTHLIESGH